MMWRKQKIKLTLRLLLALLALGTLWTAFAQETTPLPSDEVVIPGGDDGGGDNGGDDGGGGGDDDPQQQEPPQIIVRGFDPDEVVSGNGGTLTIYGNLFTAQSRVVLQGYGVLETQYLDNRTLTATLPGGLPPGEYRVQVRDPQRRSANAADLLRVRRPPNTAAPPTERPTETPIPTETPVPTVIPGQPSLLARNFTANPMSIMPGGTTTLTFEVINQGSRAAQGVFVTVDTSGNFAPAIGQSGVTLPDIPVGGVANVSLSVIAGREVTPGAATVPIVFMYRDFEGQTYTSNAALSVNILPVTEASQVVLARYLLDPNPVIPGEPVTVTILVQNTGNATATQVMLRIVGDGGILLAGPQGDSFPLGDLAAGASSSVEVPLIVSTEAKAGPQRQPVTITYLQSGEAQESTSSITVPVAEVVKPEPLLLLDSYDTGVDVLKPGDRFTLDMTLLNVGDADASNLLITFGTVEQSGGDDDSGDDTRGGGSTTRTTPSSTFAPLGGGGTIFAGTVNAEGGTLEVSQDFIVNGTVDSGIYSLPITLRYTEPDGSQSQESLRASIVVIAPPQLQTLLEMPIPESVNAGEPFPIALELTNNGKNNVDLSEARVEVDNGEVIEGAEIPLTPLKADADTLLNAMVMPLEAGPVHVTVTLHYTNELNQPETLVLSYETEALEPPPPPPMEEFPPNVVEVPTEAPEEEDMLGRLLLGLLGLGS